jgi:hypothetical protein
LRQRIRAVPCRAFALCALSTLLAGAWIIRMPPSPAGAVAETTTFSTPGNATYEVPEGVCSITVVAVGAHGGLGLLRILTEPRQADLQTQGGLPRAVSTRVPVVPGDELLIEVASDGEPAIGADTLQPGKGGIGGGGPGVVAPAGLTDTVAAGGGGGGASSVTTSTGDPLVVAGGGAGGGVIHGHNAGDSPDGPAGPGGNGGPANGVPDGSGVGGASFVVANATDVSSSLGFDSGLVRITADPDAGTCPIPLDPRFTG